MKLVSACLAGQKCRFDGTDATNQKVATLVRIGMAVPVCPEQLAHLQTPRPPAEMRQGRVVTKEGKDITAAYVEGAKEGLRVAKMLGCKEAILKSKSPSCGCGKIPDGTFSGQLVDGDGVFTKLLKQNGLKVISEEYL